MVQGQGKFAYENIKKKFISFFYSNIKIAIDGHLNKTTNLIKLIKY